MVIVVRLHLLFTFLIYVLLGIILTCSAGCSAWNNLPPDTKQEEHYTVDPDATSVEIRGTGQIILHPDIAVGDVTVWAEPRALETVLITSEAGKTTIVIDPLDQLRSLSTLEIHLPLSTACQDIVLAGAVTLSASAALTNPDLVLSLSGGCSVDLAFQDTESLAFSMVGTGVARLSGDLQNQTVSIKGAALFDALELYSAHSRVAIYGVGQAKVWARDTLDVIIDGAGTVSYRGNPEISQDISLGTLTRLDGDLSFH